ncbi:MAG: hypothetical protein FWD29_06160, partial [Micrococcales bacterium]|nr:hypothetical protein [Micrococcales bacterium]
GPPGLASHQPHHRESELWHHPATVARLQFREVELWHHPAADAPTYPAAAGPLGPDYRQGARPASHRHGRVAQNSCGSRFSSR